MKKVIVITGPTGIGKTSISVEVAKHFNASIVSADSQQVYKELNIGTAKIKEHEKKGVKHYLIDIVKPNSTFDVASYQIKARSLIDKLDRAFIVGGTGLYIQATINDYDFSNEARDFLFEEKLKDYNNTELHDLLKKKDENLSRLIHPNNRRRVLRALSENTTITKAKSEPLYNYLIIQLTLDRKQLYEKINLRVDVMINEGLVEEVKALKDKGLTFNTISYKQINDYLDGRVTLDEAVNELKKVTRRYAKRQETWFNNQMETIKIDASDKNLAIKEIIKIINEFYEE